MIQAQEITKSNNDIHLFETVYKEVEHSESEGLHLLKKVGHELKVVYDSAEVNNNSALMHAVSEAWERTNNIMNIVSRQSIVLRGGSETFKMLKSQRDQALKELETILHSLFVGDEDSHPAIEAFAHEIRGWEDEYLQQVEEELMEEMFRQRVTHMFERHTRHPNQDYLDWAADGLFDLITDEKTPTDEQKALLQKLAMTFYPDE